MKKIALIIESVSENEVWGRVQYEDNLIVEEASSIPSLEKKMKKLLKDFHGLKPQEVDFDLQYDIAGFFDQNKFLKATAIAELAGLNDSLMRQYSSGKKFPSFERVKQIEEVIHKIGRELINIKLAAKNPEREELSPGL
jgi:hypothetical protein